jgi:hypothetical protein
LTTLFCFFGKNMFLPGGLTNFSMIELVLAIINSAVATLEVGPEFAFN